VPQSLINTPALAGQALQVNGRALGAAHAQIVSILRNRLGQNHGDLLAEPLPQADGSTLWRTALTGAVTPASQLPDDERLKLQQRAQRFSGEIRALAQQLQGEGGASTLVAQMLDAAVQAPPGDWLYSVGGKPVLVMWGHGAPGTAPLPAAAAAATATTLAAGAAPTATAAAAPLGTPTAAAADPLISAAAAGHALPPPPPPPPPAPKAGGWRRWLPWALLALLLLALLLAWRSCSGGPAAAADLSSQIAEAEARNAQLEQDLARKTAAQQQCVPDPAPPPASAPAAEPASAPEPPPPASQPAPDPLDALKQRISSAGKNCDKLAEMLKSEPLLKGSGADASTLKQQMLRTMEQNCRDKAIREARNLCPGQRPKDLVPETALVFDASGSMNFSLDVNEQQIRQMGQAATVESMMRQLGMGGMGGASPMAALTREPRRITVAKRAALSVVQRLPSDMSVGLVMVDQCPQARSIGMFPPGQRGSVLSQIQGIEPRQGTPLADGIAKAGRLVDGVKREAIIVVVSDGTESCGQDPCAVAAALKREKPYLKINVVDITGTGAGNCVAQATGGKVFTARNADEVVAQMNRASQDAMGGANCKR
jgi:hypothetical protein